MAYEVPTVDDFIERFPDFADREEEPIQFALDAASRQVDESWTEGDFEEAILQLAAHVLLTSEVGAAAGSDEGIKSLTIGPLSLAFDVEGRLSMSKLETSTYGQTFLGLRRRNIAPIAVI